MTVREFVEELQRVHNQDLPILEIAVAGGWLKRYSQLEATYVTGDGDSTRGGPGVIIRMHK
jgi:hypothetical protein